MWCITSIIVRSKQKSWWHYLVILNTLSSKKLWNLHNMFEVKVHFESKLILIQWLDEEDWIKSYTKYIIYNFLTTIRPHVYDSWNITNQKKIESIMQCSTTKFPPLWYGSGFFLKKKCYNAFIVIKVQKNTVFQLNFIKNFKFQNCSRFDRCISISCTIKQFTQKFHSQS
jgi:hypothetical protein